jgi:predicted flap endonuclease-1-like 5' DNA nuclease
MFWFALEMLGFLAVASLVFFTAGWLLGWVWGKKSHSGESMDAGDAKLSLQKEFRSMLEKHQSAFREHHDKVMNALRGVSVGIDQNHQETVQRAEQVISAMPGESNFDAVLSGLKMPSMPDYTSNFSAMQKKMDNFKVNVPDYNSQLSEIMSEVRRLKSGVDANVTETKAQAQKVIAAMPAPVKAAPAQQNDFDYKVVNNEIHAARREAQEQTDSILNALNKMESTANQVVAAPVVQSSGERRDYTPLLQEIQTQIKPLHGVVDEIELLQKKYSELTQKLSTASVVTEVDTRDIENKLDHIYYLLDGVGARTSSKTKVVRSTRRKSVGKKRKRKVAKAARTYTRRRKQADDLKRIKGIGRVIERKLKSSGIRYFADIAKWSGKEVGFYENKLHFKGRIGREKWIKQAKKLKKAS